MNPQEIKQIVGRRFFEVEFTKKDGSIRKMNARVSVSKYVKGTGTLSPKVLGVWDRQVFAENLKAGLARWEAGHRAYRSIKPETINFILVNGHKYVFQNGEIV